MLWLLPFLLLPLLELRILFGGVADDPSWDCAVTEAFAGIFTAAGDLCGSIAEGSFEAVTLISLVVSFALLSLRFLALSWCL